MSEYKDKVLLIVNTGRKSKNVNQCGQLQKLYEKYKDRGFVVLAFANNQFGMEPGTNIEVRDWYK